LLIRFHFDLLLLYFLISFTALILGNKKTSLAGGFRRTL